MAIRTKIIDYDKGYREWTTRIVELGRYDLHVGVFDNRLAMIAAVNEFGTRRAGRLRNVTIPARPVFRPAVDEGRARYLNLITTLLGRVSDGKRGPKQVLTTLGLVMSSDIRKRMSHLKTPPNAPSTLKNKRGSNPWIDTGALRSAVKFRIVDRNTGEI